MSIIKSKIVVRMIHHYTQDISYNIRHYCSMHYWITARKFANLSL